MPDDLRSAAGRAAARRRFAFATVLALLVATASVHPASASAPPDAAGGSKPAAVRVTGGALTWLLRSSQTAGPADIRFIYGRSTDVPILGDWNGDGIRTPGVLRGGIFLVRNSNTPGPADEEFPGLGPIESDAPAPVPVAGDFDGDGIDTPGFVQGKHWTIVYHVKYGSDARSYDIRHFTFGRPGDVALVGDWKGDHRATPGVRRGNTWLLSNSIGASNAAVSFNYGVSADVPIVGDWNRDGTSDPGVIRGNTWLLRAHLDGGPAQVSFAYGAPGDSFLTW